VGARALELDGTPDVDKRPVAAYADELVMREPREERSTTFVAHVRYASTGPLRPENTHPFEQHGRVFTHHGYLTRLDRLEDELSEHRALVRGDTDSERLFALITRHTELSGGDLERGIGVAVRWVAEHLPVFALNFVLARQPTSGRCATEPHDLLPLERPAWGRSGGRHLDAASPQGTIRVRSGAMATRPAVVLASERMDEDEGWRLLEPGELVHVDANLDVRRQQLLDRPPRHQLRLGDLDSQVLRSQARPSSAPNGGGAG